MAGQLRVLLAIAFCLLLDAAPSTGIHIRPPPPIAYVALGGTVTLKCSATGTPTPTVRWKKGDEWLTPEDSPVSEHNLVLKDVTEEAEYTCYVGTGELVSTVTTKVEIRPLPRTPNSLEVLDVKSTTALVKWYYPYIPGTDDPTHYHLLVKPKAQSSEPEDITTTGAGTSFELTNLTPATEYQVQLVAAGTVGRGPATEPVYFTTQA